LCACWLCALRELVGRFGHGSNLNRVPIADQDEMREMVIAAFIARADTELQKLADEIARAQQGGATTAVAKALWERFSELQKAAAAEDCLSPSSQVAPTCQRGSGKLVRSGAEPEIHAARAAARRGISTIPSPTGRPDHRSWPLSPTAQPTAATQAR
jgi:hypothetical protein